MADGMAGGISSPDRLHVGPKLSLRLVFPFSIDSPLQILAMTVSMLSKVVFTGLAAATCALSAAIPEAIGKSRVIRQAEDLREEYDYIIVGGGTSGLTVADRLTESGECKLCLVPSGHGC